MKNLAQLLIGLALFVVLVGVILYGHYYHRFYKQTLDIDHEVTLNIEPGANFTRLVQQLHTRQIITMPSYWLLHARLYGWDRKLPVGEYKIPPMTVRPVDLIERLIRGDFVPMHRLTLLAGWNLRQVLDAMQKHQFIKLSSTVVETLIGQHGQNEHYKEGWLFPDTYLFKGTVDGVLLIEQAQKTMEEKLAALWETRATDLPYQSSYEALIMASIIEKEAGHDAERAKIGGVFLERLRRGMRLQADPTVIYGIKDFNGDLTRKVLRTDTPYNTYTRKGLPPTPIAMPGEASLQAAVNPDSDGSLYFVSKQDGSHYFSKTYDEHRQAVEYYQLGRPNSLFPKSQ